MHVHVDVGIGQEEEQRRLAFLASTKYVACLGEQHFKELLVYTVCMYIMSCVSHVMSCHVDRYPSLIKRKLKEGELLFKKGNFIHVSCCC